MFSGLNVTGDNIALSNMVVANNVSVICIFLFLCYIDTASVQFGGNITVGNGLIVILSGQTPVDFELNYFSLTAKVFYL